MYLFIFRHSFSFFFFITQWRSDLQNQKLLYNKVLVVHICHQKHILTMFINYMNYSSWFYGMSCFLVTCLVIQQHGRASVSSLP